MSKDFDFGFSTITEEELKALGKKELQPLADDLAAKLAGEQDRVTQIYNLFTALLKNLAADPEKHYIYWPNRQGKINEVQKLIDKIKG